MRYEEVYSRFYVRISDPGFFQIPQADAYEMMNEWLHSALSEPYIKKLFTSLTINDEIMELSYTMNPSVDPDSDDMFLKEILSDYLVVCWMRRKIDTDINLSFILGGKEEKVLKDAYKTNIARVNDLERSIKKTIRDYRYNNSNLSEGSL